MSLRVCRRRILQTDGYWGDGSTRLSLELPHGRDSSAAERVAIENQILLVAPAADGANLSSSMQVRRLIGKVARR